jgi:hypothetical protein
VSQYSASETYFKHKIRSRSSASSMGIKNKKRADVETSGLRGTPILWPLVRFLTNSTFLKAVGVSWESDPTASIALSASTSDWGWCVCRSGTEPGTVVVLASYALDIVGYTLFR